MQAESSRDSDSPSTPAPPRRLSAPGRSRALIPQRAGAEGGPVTRRGKLLGSLVALLLVGGLAWLAWSLTQQPAAPAGARPPNGGRGGPPTTVGVAVAERADIPVTLDALGTVVPLATVRVRPQVSGVLRQVHYREGQLVRQGELLASIDPRQFEMALQQATGQRMRDEAQLDAARVTLQRFRTLLEQDSIARQEVDTQAALVKQLEAAVVVSKANEGTARLNLGYTRIESPIAGRVGLRTVDVGNVVGPSDANGIAVVTQLSPIDVEFAIPQDRVDALQQAARDAPALAVRALDSTRSRVLETGRFQSLDNQVDVQTGTVRAKARFDNAKQALFPSQFVNVQLRLRTLEGAVTVPLAAVRTGANGDYVFVLNDDRTVQLRNVRRGEATAERVQITSGLQAGERVVTEGADRLRDGSRVALPGEGPRPGGGGRNGGAPGASAPGPAAAAPDRRAAQRQRGRRAGRWRAAGRGARACRCGGGAARRARRSDARAAPAHARCRRRRPRAARAAQALPGGPRPRRAPGAGALAATAAAASLAGRGLRRPDESRAIPAPAGARTLSMSPSRPFILRPVATSLLMLAIVLAGLVGLRLLPLSALPQVDYPTIQVQTLYPGASPEVMAQTVTAPLERQFGQMAGLARMSSTSAAGVSIVTLQFGLGLALDVAEQQVQAAINAGATLLPADLPAPPVYAKVNPADAPVLTLAITSDQLPLTEVQNLVDTRLALKISQVSGVGLVTLAGGQRPAVRVQVNTRELASYGLTLDNVRTAINAANANGAKGSIDGPTRSWTINSNDQLLTAEDYANLIVSYRNGAPVRLRQVAQVVQSAENVKLGAWSAQHGQVEPAIILNVQRQPGANVIATVDAIKARLPELMAGLPAALQVDVLSDRTTGIRASVQHVQIELVLAVLLVVLVIFAFLHSPRATLIASLAVPISLVGACGVMYLMGYSLNNLSLMALTIATGFVVDDAIVMIENIAAPRRDGQAADAGGDRRRQRDRLHHHLADGVADRGADPAAVHGRRGRPAVPRVRRHAGHHHPDLRGGVADAGADDVGALAEGASRRRGGRQRPGRAAAAPLRPR